MASTFTKGEKLQTVSWKVILPRMPAAENLPLDILFRVFRIPALRVEQALLNLPYISEACVLGVPHKEARAICGAIVRIRDSALATDGMLLAKIRADLKDSLPPYMLPAILSIMKGHDELPRTVSGKTIKKEALRKFLSHDDWSSTEGLPSGIEYYGCTMPKMVEAETKPWDWCGLQRAD
jgi:malonyl-CoA/methylmalonyl-CoA synthetase